MKPPEEVKREFVRQWLRKGADDLKVARHLLSAEPNLSYGAAFHAQQAAEKLLKAVLIWHQVEFAKTHDIGRILRSREDRRSKARRPRPGIGGFDAVRRRCPLSRGPTGADA